MDSGKKAEGKRNGGTKTLGGLVAAVGGLSAHKVAEVPLDGEEWVRLLAGANMTMDEDEEAWVTAMAGRVDKRMFALGVDKPPIRCEAVAAVLVEYSKGGKIIAAMKKTGMKPVEFDLGLQLWADGMKVYRYLRRSRERMRAIESEELLEASVEAMRKGVTEGLDPDSGIDLKTAKFLASRLDRKLFGGPEDNVASGKGEESGGVTYSLPQLTLEMITTPQGGAAVRVSMGKAAAEKELVAAKPKPEEIPAAESAEVYEA